MCTVLIYGITLVWLSVYNTEHPTCHMFCMQAFVLYCFLMALSQKWALHCAAVHDNTGICVVLLDDIQSWRNLAQGLCYLQTCQCSFIHMYSQKTLLGWCMVGWNHCLWIFINFCVLCYLNLICTYTTPFSWKWPVYRSIHSNDSQLALFCRMSTADRPVCYLYPTQFSCK